jgi:hypothetical protein
MLKLVAPIAGLLLLRAWQLLPVLGVAVGLTLALTGTASADNCAHDRYGP